jgi:nucleoside 2-deoxyribosyltransferase
MAERKKVYLSGPIMDENPELAKTWRERATEQLRNNFVILDPMRRNFKDREVDSANEIVEFDLQDVREADILMVNYNKTSIGTSMEVFYAAHDLGKFIVAFSPYPFQECSPWMVRYCTKILPTFEEAVQYIEDNFVVKHVR